jgi:hypothetical protein
MRTEIDPVSETLFSSFLECRMMDEVRKPSNSANSFYSSRGSCVAVERQYHPKLHVRVAPSRDLNSLKETEVGVTDV